MSQNKTLAIMAAGLSTRFGSLKQLHSITENDYAIIDFSIYDAIHSGFNHIIFIVREEILSRFKSRYKNKLPQTIKVSFVLQETKAVPESYASKIKRTKPWGTGHALLMLEHVVSDKFALINADDFYGREAFKLIHDSLFEDALNETFLIGFKLENTLSENGAVSRGECLLDSNNNLLKITERTHIERKNELVHYLDTNKNQVEIDKNTIVSMNFWGFSKQIFDVANRLFLDFLKTEYNSETSEFFIPEIVDYCIKNNLFSCKMVPTNSNWYGITYKEDAEALKKQIRFFIESEVYPKKLW
jgi:UTP-glucose-1-phosphate uridylyltransferase